MKPLDALLEQNSLFAQMRAEQREELARRAIRREFQKGEFISHYGDAWPYLLLIEDGAIDLLRESEEGRSLVFVGKPLAGSGSAFLDGAAWTSERSRDDHQVVGDDTPAQPTFHS